MNASVINPGFAWIYVSLGSIEACTPAAQFTKADSVHRNVFTNLIRRSVMTLEHSSALRGSSKLFSIATDDHEGLAKAVGLARNDYEVKWWWKYGQPAIDWLHLVIEVSPEKVASTVGQLLKQNNAKTLVTTNVSPYGTGYQVEVNVRTSL
jgi:hypothetical protein